MDFSNENLFPQPGPPSRIPSMQKLREMSASANNARSSSMPPPPANLPGRKTLVETGGELYKPKPAHSNSRSVNAAAKTTFIAGPSRQASSSVSSSYQSSASSSRHASFSTSVGPGARQPSAQVHRSQSAMANSRLQRPTPNPSRPLTALEVHAETSNMSQGEKKRKASWGQPEDRLSNMEKSVDKFKQDLEDMNVERTDLREVIGVYKVRITELDSIKIQLTTSNTALQAELEESRSHVRTSATALEDSKRFYSFQIDDLQRQHRRDLEDASRQSQEESRDLIRRHEEEMDDMKKRLESAVENETKRRQAEVQALTTEGALTQQRTEMEVEKQREATRAVEESLQQLRADLLRERGVNSDLRVKLSESSHESSSLETTIRSLRAHVDFLESDNKSQSNAFVDLETRLQSALRSASEANEKLRNEETLRRKLHNQVQELKGNIRVFCRVRPSLSSEPANEAARIMYPDTGKDSKEVEILGPEEKSSLGNVTTKTNAFTFDRIFTPDTANTDVFEEISQLVQSALDGYNVCIFCYGQTGSGKTYTMSAEDGMIPLAVRQIYDTAKSLEEKGWKYSMEGSFIEVYNENLNDLLGKPDEYDKKKHDIRHDMQKCKTTVTDITTVDLDAPSKVESILRRATANRSVAATKANERSSRSHSVFILKLTGQNDTTGEKSEGTLNLVDLAGSERLSHSKATGERLKETQNINKSLSCLGDVISALGQGKEGGHIPYRNSKLTYLLQFSLGGNSKTLMFVMISPLQAHLNETLTSLKFATKVHNTHIGTAKRQAKIRDS